MNAGMPEGCHGMTDSRNSSTKGLLAVTMQMRKMIRDTITF